MNFKTTLILFVLVVAGLFLLIYSGESPDATTEEGASPASPATVKTEYVFGPALNSSDFVSIELRQQGEPNLKFVRETNPDNPAAMMPWRMTEPITSDAEPSMVEGLATLVDGLQYTRSFKPGQGEVTAAEAGLEPPQADLSIIDKDGKEIGLQIGNSLALSNDTYIRVTGKEEILVTSLNMTYRLDKKASDYRSKTLLGFTSSDVKRVEMDFDNRHFDLVRGTGADWIINQPVKAYGQPDNIKKLLDAASRVRVKEFTEDNPASLDPFGLTQPMFMIRITTEHTEEVKNTAVGPETQPAQPTFKTVVATHTLLVGNTADLKSTTRYVKREDLPWVAVVPQAQLDRIMPKISDLRDPRITHLKADAVTALELDTSEGTAVLSKQNGRWQGEGDLADLDTEAIQALLRTIEDVAAIDYVESPQTPEEYGLDAPRARLTITADNELQPLVLIIGKNTPSGQNAYIQIEGQDSIMVITAQRADELAIEPLSLRSRVMTALLPDSIQSITITRSDHRYQVERKSEGGGWSMIEPENAPPDVSQIRSLVNDLARLRAARVVAKNEMAAYGLDAPEIMVDFEARRELEGPPPTDPQAVKTEVEIESHTLRIARHDGRIYAALDEIPYVFQLDQTVYDVIAAEYIVPALFDIKASDVTAVKIETPANTLDFARADKEWTYTPDPTVQLATKAVDELVKALVDLRVTGYIAYRDALPGSYGLESAPVTVVLSLKDESTVTLKIDQTRSDQSTCKAAWIERQRVFLLPFADVEKLLRGLDPYLLANQPEPEEQPKRSIPSARPVPHP